MKKKTHQNDAAAQAPEAAGPIGEALTDDQLDQISGAGNPFDKVPRVPTQPIDDDLRRDG